MKPGSTGWLVAPDDAEELEEAMVDAVNNGERRARMGANARRDALESYGWAQIAARVREAVEAVAGEAADTARLAG